VDLKTSNVVPIAAAFAFITALWCVVRMAIDIQRRRVAWKKIKSTVVANSRSTAPQREVQKVWVGDFFSAWLWCHAERIVGKRTIFNHACGVRPLTFVWRFAIYAILVGSIEGTIAANNLSSENEKSFGQALSLILLVIPIHALWSIVYRTFALLRKFLNNYGGQYFLLAGIAVAFVIANLFGISELIESRWLWILTAMISILIVFLGAPWALYTYKLRNLLQQASQIEISSLWMKLVRTLEIDSLDAVPEEAQDPLAAETRVDDENHPVRLPDDSGTSIEV
jgi:hypothetical protein